MEKTKIIEKVKKLLETNGRKEQEAQVALQKAQELIAKYNLENKDLETTPREVVLKYLSKQTKGVSDRLKMIAVRIAEHYRCRVVASKYMIGLIGFEEDCCTCEYVITYIQRVFNKTSKAIDELMLDRTAKVQAKNSYLEGFLSGCVFALKETEEKYALVLKVPAEVDEYIENQNYRQGSFKLNTANSLIANECYSLGFDDGKTAFKDKNRLASPALR